MVQTALAKEDAALESLQKALHFDPPHRDARKRLAGLLRDLGRSQEAVQVFEQVLADRPAAETYADFGSLLLTLGQVKEAAAAYRMAIGLKPDFAAAHFNLAQSLEELHDAASARQHFFQAAQLQPDRPLWRLRGLTCGPAVFENAQEIEEHSESFENAIHYAPRHGYGTGPVPASLDDIVQVGLFPGFALSYHGRNQRRLKEQFAAFYEPYFRDQTPPTGSGNRSRPRIGFHVSRRHEHIFLACMRGIIERIRAERFEIVILAPRAVAASLGGRGLTFVPLGDSLPGAIRQIRAAACDLIYYWEVGSDPLNYFLPFARLCPSNALAGPRRSPPVFPQSIISSPAN